MKGNAQVCGRDEQRKLGFTEFMTQLSQEAKDYFANTVGTGLRFECSSMSDYLSISILHTSPVLLTVFLDQL